MKLRLLAQELVRRPLDGRKAAKVKLKEDGLLACRLLQGCDRLLRLFLASSSEVHLRIMLEQSLENGCLTKIRDEDSRRSHAP